MQCHDPAKGSGALRRGLEEGDEPQHRLLLAKQPCPGLAQQPIHVLIVNAALAPHPGCRRGGEVHVRADARRGRALVFQQDQPAAGPAHPHHLTQHGGRVVVNTEGERVEHTVKRVVRQCQTGGVHAGEAHGREPWPTDAGRRP
eukprot:scaffold3092_cov121-Isochrysis_galbana.AAC.2